MMKHINKAVFILPLSFLLTACNYQTVDTVKCYGDGYSLKKTYNCEEGKAYIQFNRESSISKRSIGVGRTYSPSSIGTLNYKISYKYDKNAKKLKEIVNYSSIHYDTSIDFIGEEITWLDIYSYGETTHKFKMPKEGDSISYTNIIDLSVYRYIETS